MLFHIPSPFSKDLEEVIRELNFRIWKLGLQLAIRLWRNFKEWSIGDGSNWMCLSVWMWRIQQWYTEMWSQATSCWMTIWSPSLLTLASPRSHQSSTLMSLPILPALLGTYSPPPLGFICICYIISVELRQFYVTHEMRPFGSAFRYFDSGYFTTQKLTTASDVHSYGVVLLELLTGQEVIDHISRGEEYNLIKWVSNQCNPDSPNPLIFDTTNFI